MELVTDRIRRPGQSRNERTLTVALGPDLDRALDDLAAGSGVDRETLLLGSFRLLSARYGRDTDAMAPARSQSLPEFARALGARDGGTPPDGASPAHEPAVDADLRLDWEPGATSGTLRYDGAVLDPATVERLASHYRALLASATRDHGAPAASLEHTTPDERALLAQWGVEAGSGRPPTLLDGFRRQVESCPGALALEFDDGSCTYLELDRAAERFAAELTRHAVAPGDVVALAMDRSAALVVAVLGVLKAGAAYLPLDPEYPTARLALMVADSRARVVVADGPLSWAPGVPVLDHSELLVSRADPTRTLDRRSEPGPDDVACVLYTSGSTGTPKGVLTTHRAIVRLVVDAPFFPCGVDDVVAQASSPSFDSASLEIWGALLNGARLAGVPKHDVLSAHQLQRRIARHHVTAMFLPTSVFHLHADVAPQIFAGLRDLYFGGEPADARRVARVRAAAPGVRLVNGYGPTECTTFATTFEAGGESAGPEAALPIGRPIPETSVHVLDDRLRECGIGVPGELYIGGSGLARGYLGRPAMTSTRFVASPFGDGERLYRTGDVARWRADGLLECRGRVDSQVKVRGVRIEPEEVASVLATHPAVRSAVVEVRGHDDARGLVAYLVPEGDPAPGRAEVRSFVAERLPAALVPTWFVPLAELPLTPNGKLDRRALPEPGTEDVPRAASGSAPRGPVEQAVAAAWSNVLGLEDISADDDFLALGGNSLLATRVVAQLGVDLGVRLGVRDLFEAPTVAALAARVATATSTRSQPAPVPAGTGGSRPMSYAQERMWFLDGMAQNRALYNVPLVLSFEGAVDVPALARAFAQVVARHAALRTVLKVEAGVPTQQVLEDADIALEADDLRALPEDRRAGRAAELSAQEAATAFDLVRGPLVRARLLRLTDTRSDLLITLHHAICDGWSVTILLDDLAAFYAAETGHGPAVRPALPVEYTDFALWQRRLLDDGLREAQLAYWTERLADAPVALRLPMDHPRPEVPRHRGDSIPLRMPADLTKLLLEGSRHLGVTPFTSLLATFQLLMGRYAGVRDVCVATPVSGRTRPEFDSVVGCFINTLVLRARWSDSWRFAELVEQVRADMLAAYDHQDLPLEDVVAALNPPRTVGLNPFAQVMLAMQNIPESIGGFPGARVGVREHAQQSKLDVVLRWAETPGASGELTGFAEYDVDLFERSTIERLVRDFCAVLEAGLRDPDTMLSALSGGVDPLAGHRDDPVTELAGRPAAAAVGPLAEEPAPHPLVARIAGVWADVLGLASVRPEDNFFEVGGTSMLALRIQAGLEEALGRKVPIVELFRHPTVSQLAEHLALDPAPQDSAAPGAEPAAATTRPFDRKVRPRARRTVEVER